MLSLEMWTAGVALLALTLYTVLAGADFGGGVWDLCARGPRAEAQRQAIAEAMGPVWEANHVWLIFLIVLLFTGFPAGFAALSVALFVPFHLVLAGIILRGAAFVFRAPAASAAGPQRVWARVFGSASVIAPLLLGACLGAVSAGRIRVQGGVVQSDLWTAWITPLSAACALLALMLFAYLAAVYLTVETRGALRDDFRHRAIWAGTATAALAAAVLPLIATEAPRLLDGLLAPRALPIVGAGVALALASAWAVFRRHYRIARVTAVGEVVMLLWGWALAQWPYLIYPDVTFATAAAPPATLEFVLLTLPFGALLLVPSLWLLFRVFKGRNPAVDSPARRPS